MATRQELTKKITLLLQAKAGDLSLLESQQFLRDVMFVVGVATIEGFPDAVAGHLGAGPGDGREWSWGHTGTGPGGGPSYYNKLILDLAAVALAMQEPRSKKPKKRRK
jgi:hypothetical protein